MKKENQQTTYPPLHYDQKNRLISRISTILRKNGCVLAVMFGSFVSGSPFRDIDLLIALKGKRHATPSDLLYLSQVLENETGFPFDLISMDVSTITLRAEIARKGQPIIMDDESLWDEFCYHAWIDEMDFRPMLERFYEERFGNQQG